MEKKIVFLLFMSLLLSKIQGQHSGLEYPETHHTDVKDNYFGTWVKDPYRWLEAPDSQAVTQWVNAQNQVTFGFLEQIPFRDKIKERLTEVWNYERFSAPFRAGEYYFFYKNDGLQNQSVIYRQKGLEGKPEVFLDPNTFSESGTIALTDFTPSHDGRFIAYGTAVGGSDWKEFKILDARTGELLTDHIQWVKFSGVSWYKEGFYYSRYDKPEEGSKLSAKNEFHKVYYHKLGTPQSADELIYEDKEHPLRNFYLSVTEDERYLAIYGTEGAGNTNLLFVKDLTKPNSKITPVIRSFHNQYWVSGTVGDKLLIFTDEGAPKGKLMLASPHQADSSAWETLVPESDFVLESVSQAGGKLFLKYMQDITHHVYVYDYKGNKESEIQLPDKGTVSGFGGKDEDQTIFYTFNSFIHPGTIYKYDVKSGKSELFRKSGVDFNPEDYVTSQVFYESKDGTMVPMFIVHKKGINMDGKNPTLLYGYGGFNISIQPSFSTSRIVFLENGGVYAVANLRGGSEYGEEWHKAGMKSNKQNVFDDFIAAAEYLIDQKYTSSDYLAIQGRSNGGLLVGAAMTQRPELFKVAFPGVGVMDMLRFHKFTIGHAWVAEYGSSDNSEDFDYLYQYSPVHNIRKDVKYPATMVTTADHDDRVVPAHSYKFIATLQEKHAGEAPVLIRIETMAGHGAGKPTSKVIEEEADVWSFLFYNMGIDPLY